MKLEYAIIDSVETWKEYASPLGGDRQWRDGRSAKELAKYIIQSKGTMPKKMQLALSDCCGVSCSFTWIPEYVTPFDKEEFGKGEGRHHDLAMFSKNAFVGIEAKADEPFDKPLGQWKESGKTSSAKENREKRANAMCKLLFGEDSTNYQEIHYQLLSAMTGVLLEAEKRGVEVAVLLIITFKKNGSNNKPAWDPKKIDKNEKALEAFRQKLKYDSTTDRVEIPGTKMRVYIKDIVVD